MNSFSTIDFNPWFNNMASKYYYEAMDDLFDTISKQVQIHNKEYNPDKTYNLPLNYLEHQIEKCFDQMKANALSELKTTSFNKTFTTKTPQPAFIPILLNTTNITMFQIAKIAEASQHMEAIPSLAFLDLETDGLNIETANILQIAIIIPVINSQYESLHYFKTWSSYVKPHEGYKQIDNSAYHINHIGDKELETAPSLYEICQEVENLLKNKIIIGYNCNSFDIPILKRHLERNDCQLPHKFSIDLFPACWKNKKQTLADAIKAYNLKPNPNPHDALADASCCIDLLLKLIEEKELPNNEEELLDLYSSSKNTWHKRKINVIEFNQNFLVNHRSSDTPNTTSALKRRYSQLSLSSNTIQKKKATSDFSSDW